MTSTTFPYPKSDFVTSGGAINVPVFEQELADVSLSQDVESVKEVGSDVYVTLSGIAVPADETAIDGVVAAHGGVPFSSSKQSQSMHEDFASQAPGETTETEWVGCLTHNTGPLSAGTYSILNSSEIKLDAEVAGDDVEAHWVVRNYRHPGLGVTIPEMEYGTTSHSGDKWLKYTDGVELDVLDGDSLEIACEFRKSGPGSAKAMIRRCRLTMRPAN